MIGDAARKLKGHCLTCARPLPKDAPGKHCEGCEASMTKIKQRIERTGKSSGFLRLLSKAGRIRGGVRMPPGTVVREEAKVGASWREGTQAGKVRARAEKTNKLYVRRGKLASGHVSLQNATDPNEVALFKEQHEAWTAHKKVLNARRPPAGLYEQTEKRWRNASRDYTRYRRMKKREEYVAKVRAWGAMKSECGFLGLLRKSRVKQHLRRTRTKTELVREHERKGKVGPLTAGYSAEEMKTIGSIAHGIWNEIAHDLTQAVGRRVSDAEAIDSIGDRLSDELESKHPHLAKKMYKLPKAATDRLIRRIL